MSASQPGADRTIVVGVDGSPHSLSAVRWAAHEAALRNADMLIVHVNRGSDYDAPMWPIWGLNTIGGVAEKTLEIVVKAEKLALETEPNISVRTEMVDGPTTQNLLRFTDQAVMAVFGQTGGGGFGQLVISATALKIARHAHCPVVVIPNRCPPGTHVVVGVDGSDHSRRALAWAFEEAALRKLPLQVVSAVPSAAKSKNALMEQRRGLLTAVVGCSQRHPDVTVEYQLTHEHPVRALFDAADNAELLVVGARGRGGFVSLLLGSVSEAVVRHTTCPTLVVR